MAEVISIRFRGGSKNYYFDPRGLQVAAEELYPENYDFSIIFDTVENRKLRHRMERKYVEGEEILCDS